MATPTADSYTAPAGARNIRLGRGGLVVPPALVALIGDSLTAQSYGVTPWWWQVGVAGGVLKTIHNAGVGSETVSNMLSRVNNATTAGSPGFAGLAPLGWIALRAGTNNARVGAINGTIQTQYSDLIAALKTYLAAGGKILVFPVPPLGGSSIAANANVPGYNSYLQSLVAADPTHLVWVDDCSAVRDGSGNQLADFFSDGIHMNAAGTMQMGITGGSILSTLLAPYGYASPVSADAADVYPAQPQWNPNHVNAGSAANAGSFGGTVPTGYSVGTSGAGASATVSVGAADGGDSNSTPWLRIAPTVAQSPAGSVGLVLTRAAAGRAITSGDPAALDVVLQIRFNAFDANRWGNLRLWLQDSAGGKLCPELTLKLGGDSALTRTVTLRQALPRTTTNAAAGATIYAIFESAAAFSGAMGSFDIRCFTFRG